MVGWGVEICGCAIVIFFFFGGFVIFASWVSDLRTQPA